MKKLLLLFLFFPLFVVASVRVKPPEAILGNWLSPTNNDWKYGFYRDFAILDGDFWEYRQITALGDVRKITFANKGLTRSLYVKRQGDGIAAIGKTRNSLLRFKLKRNPSPDFANYETTGFRQPLIHEGLVRLKGYLRGYDPHAAGYRMVSVLHFALVEDKERIFVADLDSLGRFSIDFPLLNPQEVMLQFGDQLLEVYTEPGKDLVVCVDIARLAELSKEPDYFVAAPLRGDCLDFMGGSGLLNTEIREFFPRLFRNVIRDAERKMDLATYKTYRLKRMNDLLTELDDYGKTHHSGLKFRQRTEMSIRYGAGNELLRYNYQFRKGDPYPESYLEFTRQIPFNNELAVVTWDYGDFLRTWLMSNFEVNGVSSWSEIPLSETVAEARLAGFTISREDEQFMIAHDPEKTRNSKTDSTKLMELYIKHDDGLDTGVRRVADHRDDKIKDKAIALADAEQPGGIAKALLVAKRKTWELDGNRSLNGTLLLSDSVLAIYEKKIAYPAIYAELRKYHEVLAARLRGDLPADVHLLNTAWQKGGDVMAGIASKYKGKVVYVDFWAPWCGPCMGEMPNSKRLQAEFKDRDIVFLFLGVQCSKESWEQTIKANDIKGEHYLLTRDEYALLSRRFRIDGIPRYMVLDAAGKVVNEEAPRPGDAAAVNQINKLLH